MPTANKLMKVEATGDSAEILETSAMTQGAYVRSRIVFKPELLEAAAHVHPFQDETYEVLSGRLTYILKGKTFVAEAGQKITLPRNVAHRHHCGGSDETVTILTITPGLDFDYLLETVFGLANEGKVIGGRVALLQGLVWLQKLKGPLAAPGLPFWMQRLLAAVLGPIGYLLGYRAVYTRFSGEEW